MVGGITAFAGCSPERTPARQEPTTRLTCAIHAEDSCVGARPVNVRFTLFNHTDSRLYVLAWYTPLEGLAGDIFRVARDGKALSYHGMMMKRGDPSSDEYVSIGPRASVSATVDLSEGYDLSEKGSYRVQFVSRVCDVVTDKASIPRPRDAHQAIELASEPVSLQIVDP